MLDFKEVVGDLEGYRVKLAQRNCGVDFDRIGELVALRKEAIASFDSLRFEQREAGKAMRTLKGEQAAELRLRLKQMSDELKQWEQKRVEDEEALRDIMLYIPNIALPDVPVGEDESANVVVRTWGKPREFDFTVRAHDEIAQSLSLIDFTRAAKVSGARHAFLTGDGCLLELALMQLMLQMHVANGYVPVMPPYLVNRDSMTATGQLPKFEDDAYKTQDDMFLIPTAEVPVTNLYRDEILDGDDLPLKYTAYSACFRLEAGNYGKDTKGLIRQHQFDKVELLKFVKPEESEAEHLSLLSDAESILQALELPYRVVLLSSGDMGFSAAKCYDLEVWLPSQQCYREISSCSLCTDYQARRGNIRYRESKGAKPAFVHTINGSGLAVGRTLVAILENYQQADGSVLIPDALQVLMGKQRLG